MATYREYSQFNYNSFKEKWQNEDIELCVYDSFVKEDEDWFNLYKQ